MSKAVKSSAPATEKKATPAPKTRAAAVAKAKSAAKPQAGKTASRTAKAAPKPEAPAKSGKTAAVRQKTAKAGKAVKEKIKKLPSVAKEAPKKIVEHTLEATLITVEKAAEHKARRASQKALRATVKARKAVRAMLRAKRAARLAEAEMKAISSSFPLESETKTEPRRAKKAPVGAKDAAAGITHATTAAAKKAARELRERIKNIIHPGAEEIFFYERRQIVMLTLVYAALSCILWALARGLIEAHLITSWFVALLLTVVMFLTLAAFASVVFVLIFPQTLAVITREGIKIDHNSLLKWQDVALAEEKYTSPLTRRAIIALHLKPAAENSYRLTFMQRLCRHNVFTPFSIPLYAMDAEDAEKIRGLIKKRVKYQDARS